MKTTIAVILLALFWSTGVSAGPLIQVYKSPSCGCCTKWISHLQENGFKVETHNVKSMTPYKIEHGISPQMASCHTAMVDGYVIEGHVPASDIKQLLKTRPAIKGLTVPGMPVGSPGMEQGNYKQPYNVIAFDKNGKTTVFATHK